MTTSTETVPASQRLTSTGNGRDIALGRATLGVGASGELARRVQWTLFSLGYADVIGRPDGHFGPKTEAAVRSYQRDANLLETGVVDRETLAKLEADAHRRSIELRALSPSPADKVGRYRIVIDMVACRLCVVECGTNAPKAMYLTSPGTSEHPTHGDHFTVRRTAVMSAWNPPPSAWAADLKSVGGGVDNPMGMCKLDLDAHTQFIHGIPKEEEPELGHAASHGCLRVSGANILELHERFAGAGTNVALIRDPAESAALLARFAAAGVAVRSITEGRCYVAPYLYGEMGTNERLMPDGSITVGGRG